jgi:hypothetical protein
MKQMVLHPVFTASGNYVYVAAGESGLIVLDASGSTLSELDTATFGDFAYDVAVSGDYAYVAANASGLLIYDISTKTAISPEGTYDTNGTAEDIVVSDNYAYVADGVNGLVVVDISNEALPTLAGHYDTAAMHKVSPFRQLCICGR